MAGELYIVATPIGNLSDLTPRAAETFAKADFIAAEDTRVTVKLLNHLGIKKPMVSYYEHNLKERGEYILERVQNGETCALCSDAGMPAISDPGEDIVREAHKMGIRVIPIPAASAAVTALCVSGQVTGRFVFEGFLPTNRRSKKERLEFLQGEERTIIFYEAPHKLNTTLDDLVKAFGGARAVTVCRELTKLHEEIKVTTLGEAAAYFAQTPPRGEFVLIMAGADKAERKQYTLEDASQIAEKLMQNGDGAAVAAKKAAAETGFAKSDIYRVCLNRADKKEI
ncbi:MAG: 16S rRNA (cytidine(1402)-2'-O)-methyltransferase [Oscillospiraceae bacterium]